MAQVRPAPVLLSVVTIRRTPAGSMTEALRAIDRSAQTNGYARGKQATAPLAQGLLKVDWGCVITAGSKPASRCNQVIYCNAKHAPTVEKRHLQHHRRPLVVGVVAGFCRDSMFDHSETWRHHRVVQQGRDDPP